MPQPPRYDRDADFTKNHGSVQNDALLNSELDDISQTINALRSRQALILNDDDSIRNGIIGESQMSQDIKSIINESKENALNALATSMRSEEKANGAITASNTAITSAEVANTNANEALIVSLQAKSDSENALIQAQASRETAESASETASAVRDLCDTAIGTANQAATTAGDANSNANTAIGTANNSLEIARDAKNIAESAEQSASESALAAQSAMESASISAQSALNSENRVNTAISGIPSVVENEVGKQIGDELTQTVTVVVRQVTPSIVEETVGENYATSSALNQEIQNRQADIATVQSNIGTVLGNLAGETQARTNADNTLQENITALDNSLKTVAKTGAYSDLTGKPTLATVATSGSYNDLKNKPTIPTVPTNVSAFTNDANYLTPNSTLDSAKLSTITGDLNFSVGRVFATKTETNARIAVMASENDVGGGAVVLHALSDSRPGSVDLQTRNADGSAGLALRVDNNGNADLNSIRLSQYNLPDTSSFESPSLPPHNGTYTPAHDGWLSFLASSSASGQYIRLSSGSGFHSTAYSSATGQNLAVAIPVVRGQAVNVQYTVGGTTKWFRLCRAFGSKWEA